MRRLYILLSGVPVIAGCSDQAGDQQRLLDWRKVTIEQALACDRPMLEMKDAMAAGDDVRGSAAASRTASVCKEATLPLAQFGELPGKGSDAGENSSVTSVCGLDLMATAKAAEQTVKLIDGDTRPSVRAAIAQQLDKRRRYMAECQADFAARAKSLNIDPAKLEAIVKRAREKARPKR